MLVVKPKKFKRNVPREIWRIVLGYFQRPFFSLKKRLIHNLNVNYYSIRFLTKNKYFFDTFIQYIDNNNFDPIDIKKLVSLYEHTAYPYDLYQQFPIEYDDRKKMWYIMINNKINYIYNIYSILKNPKMLFFINQYFYELLEDPMFIYHLSNNKQYLPILNKYPEIIDWNVLSAIEFTNIVEWIDKYLPITVIPLIDKVFWNQLSKNKYAILYLLDHKEYIDWNNIGYNENAIELIENNINNLLFTGWLPLNYNKNGIELLLNNPDKIYYDIVCSNQNGHRIIEKYIDIYRNNPNFAIHMADHKNNLPIIKSLLYGTDSNIWIELWKDTLFWKNISKMSEACNILNDFREYVDYESYCINENIFEKKE